MSEQVLRGSLERLIKTMRTDGGFAKEVGKQAAIDLGAQGEPFDSLDIAEAALAASGPQHERLRIECILCDLKTGSMTHERALELLVPGNAAYKHRAEFIAELPADQRQAVETSAPFKKEWRTIIVGLPIIRKLLSAEAVELESFYVCLVPDDVLWDNRPNRSLTEPATPKPQEEK